MTALLINHNNKYLIVDFTIIFKHSLGTTVCSSVQRQAMNININSTRHIVYFSTFTNMAAVRNAQATNGSRKVRTVINRFSLLGTNHRYPSLHCPLQAVKGINT